MCGYVVGVAISVDGNEGTEQHTKLRRGECGWRILEDSGEGFPNGASQPLAVFLSFLAFAPALLEFGVNRLNAARMKDRAFGGAMVLALTPRISGTPSGANLRNRRPCTEILLSTRSVPAIIKQHSEDIRKDEAKHKDAFRAALSDLEKQSQPGNR